MYISYMDDNRTFYNIVHGVLSCQWDVEEKMPDLHKTMAKTNILWSKCKYICKVIFCLFQCWYQSQPWLVTMRCSAFLVADLVVEIKRTGLPSIFSQIVKVHYTYT